MSSGYTIPNLVRCGDRGATTPKCAPGSCTVADGKSVLRVCREFSYTLGNIGVGMEGQF